MKKLIITALASTFVFGTVGLAEANFIEDFFNNVSVPNSLKMDNNATATINFDLTKTGNTALINSTTITPVSGFDVSNFNVSDMISSALLNLSFSSNAKSGTGTIDIKFTDGNFNYDLYNGAIANFTQDLNQIASLKNYISDGKFTTSITVSGMSKNGNNNPYFEITDAKLNVSAQAVPLPAAGLLLGSGLIGLIGVKRKQQAA